MKKDVAAVIKNKQLEKNHIDDLMKSGLNDETIAEAAIESLSAQEFTKETGFNLLRVESVYRIPYDEGFCRYRLFYQKRVEGMPKYFQKAGTSNRLYFTNGANEFLADVGIPLYITEGEKKTLKANQEGLACIGLSGLWSWSNGNKQLINDFSRITLEGRKVYIVPDNDWESSAHGYSANLKQAVEALAGKLIERGAHVFIVELPKSRAKIGLDEYLVDHTIEEFRLLKVKEMVPAENQAKPENKTENKKKQPKQQLLSAHFDGLIDIVEDETGKPAFLVKADDDVRVESEWEVEDRCYVPPAKEKLPFLLPKAAGVGRWFDEDGDGLYEDLVGYFKRFSYLPDKVWPVVATWTFLTYQQDNQGVHYFPNILFYALPERGKSRTGKAITYVAYRGIHLNQIREANLFRYSNDLHATIFLDIMDFWGEAKNNNAKDILLGRFEKGQRIARVMYPERGSFDDTKYFDVFGPTIIATNRAVDQILDSRCLSITMPNAPSNTYEDAVAEKGLELKERLVAWRAKNYQTPLPEILPVDGITGRLWDVSKPLLQMAKLVCEDEFDHIVKFLRGAEGERVSERRTTLEGQIIAAIQGLLPKGDFQRHIVTVQQLLTKVNATRDEGQKIWPQSLGTKLRSMGIITRHVKGYAQIVLQKSDFDKLLLEFGYVESLEETA